MSKIVLLAAAIGTLGLTGCTTAGNSSGAQRFSAKHYSWCARQYTSYRRFDNSYTLGPGVRRRRCSSPFS